MQGGGHSLQPSARCVCSLCRPGVCYNELQLKIQVSVIVNNGIHFNSNMTFLL